MGLDITAYGKLTPAPDAEMEDGQPVDWECYVQIRESLDFPGRIEPLTDGVVYSFADSFGFRAGSYSGYNAWREWLAKLAGYPAADGSGHGHVHSAGAWAVQDGPFHKLINFTDCDGTLGPAVSAKLAAEFAEWDDRAKAAANEPWLYQSYQNWRRAFEMAADGGAVDFH
jgi:hypothetical protein